MLQTSPFLLFDGNCAEAMTFYQSCLGGELTATKVADTPMKEQFPAEKHNRIIYAQLKNNAIDISAADWMASPTLDPVQGNTTSIYLTGKPAYDAKERIMQFAQLDFDIRTKDLLVKSAGWLFNKRILNEIQQYSRFDLGSLIDSSMVTMNQQLNREIMPGIKSYGKMNHLSLLGL